MSVLSLFAVASKKALVTGAAQGIGEVLSLALAESGADVALVDLDLDRTRSVAGRITSLGRTAIALKADVSSAADLQKLVDEVVSGFGRIDILINCAATYASSPAEDMNPSDWERVIEVSLKGTFLCCQAVGRQMIRQGGGVIVNFSSLCSKVMMEHNPQAP